MDTSAEINQDLRNATVERKKQGGHRCLSVKFCFGKVCPLTRCCGEAYSYLRSSRI